MNQEQFQNKGSTLSEIHLNAVSGSCKRELPHKGTWMRSWCWQQGRESTVPRPKEEEQSRSGDGNHGQPAVWWLPARYITMRQVYGQVRIRQDLRKIRQGNTMLFRQGPWVRPELKCSSRAAEHPQQGFSQLFLTQLFLQSLIQGHRAASHHCWSWALTAKLP